MRVFRALTIGVILLDLFSMMSGQTRLIPPEPSGKQFQPTSQVADRRAEVQRANALNANERKQLVADVDKLSELGTTLKNQVHNTSLGALSADAVKNAGEIEKLAHSVQKRLKQYPYLPSIP